MTGVTVSGSNTTAINVESEYGNVSVKDVELEDVADGMNLTANSGSANIENINVTKKCVFRSNHASNYLSLKGDLPYDKQAMLNQIAYAKKNLAMLKPEYFRAL